MNALIAREANPWRRVRERFTTGNPECGADLWPPSEGMWGQNLQGDPLWCESEPHKVTGQ
ncbi:unnamed protein product [marine sediment metagenome]|uniref:Uncharacterized protein n=1 Tax=marine sediment metagenome TaxID=412755 RepID=X1G7B7_9ZZZZ